jgi:5-methylcytosine-specific restriction endonuclease McrA
MTWSIMRKKLLPGSCVYCGARGRKLDHIRPRIKGGMDNEENLVPCCSDCNNGRGGKHRRLLTEWDPVRVEHGRKCSPKVEAEWQRLQGASAGLA